MNKDEVSLMQTRVVTTEETYINKFKEAETTQLYVK